MRIAVIGGGIAGLTAAYLLSRRHRVRLFEAAPRLGGHTYTVPVREGERELRIDMGFIVYNDRNYPCFVRLMDELGVERDATSMSFSVRCEKTGLEYCGSSLNQLFAQRRNLLSWSFYRMVLGILRFHRQAPELLESAESPTLGEYIDRRRLPRPLVEKYLLPMTAAIWSTEAEKALEFPARTLAAFLHNHGMLTVDDRPQWRVIRGGSQTYVDAMAGVLGGRVVTGAPIARVERFDDRVEVQPRDADAESFDRAVVAAHSDQALAMLADPSPQEGSVLGAIRYRDNDVVLHHDASLLPRRPLARASWNYHLNAPGDGVQVTYSMNRLQGLDAEREYCVTLNRTDDVDPGKVLERVSFAHPQYTHAAVEAQERWEEVDGVRRTHFCGAYWGYGFHEDGVKSALRVCEKLGVAW